MKELELTQTDIKSAYDNWAQKENISLFKSIGEISQTKLLKFIKTNGKSLDELDHVLNELYGKFDIK